MTADDQGPRGQRTQRQDYKEDQVFHGKFLKEEMT
jgi:hypothetical protein